MNLLNETGLSLDRLLSFCRVADAGGVTRAANGDPTKQSLYSRQIKELEGFFGVELIQRKGRGIVLTSAGRRLRVVVRECFAVLEDFKSQCNASPVGVVVAAGESIIQWLLLPRLPHIRKTLPETELKILNLPTSQVVDRLVDGTVDFGIVRKTAVTKPLIGKSLGSFRYALFVPEALCLERKASESSRLLMNLPLATLEGEGAFRKALDRQARKEELTLRIELECASFPLVARAVQTEALAAILPTLAAGELRGAKAREFKLDILSALEREMCIAWNPRLLRIRPALEPIKTMMAKMLAF